MVQQVHEDVLKEIEENDRKFMALYKQGDCAGVAALYTADAVLMPPGFDFVHGKEAIRQTFEAFRSMGILELVFDVIEVDKCADRAIEMSTFKLLGQEQQVLDQGKYIVVWKRENGEWKLHRDIFNSSVPPK